MKLSKFAKKRWNLWPKIFRWAKMHQMISLQQKKTAHLLPSVFYFSLDCWNPAPNVYNSRHLVELYISSWKLSRRRQWKIPRKRKKRKKIEKRGDGGRKKRWIFCEIFDLYISNRENLCSEIWSNPMCIGFFVATVPQLLSCWCLYCKIKTKKIYSKNQNSKVIWWVIIWWKICEISVRS